MELLGDDAYRSLYHDRLAERHLMYPLDPDGRLWRRRLELTTKRPVPVEQRCAGHAFNLLLNNLSDARNDGRKVAAHFECLVVSQASHKFPSIELEGRLRSERVRLSLLQLNP
jgi:hypothetical protein